jgi:hypothetical protein
MSTKIVILQSFVFGVIIYTAYSAKLISFLSVTKVIHPFNSLQELLESREYTVGTVNGSAPYAIMNNAPKNSIKYRVRQELMKNDDIVKNIEEGVERIRNNRKYAFIWDKTTMIPHMTNDNCEFMDIKFDLGSNILAMAWNPNLPHRYILDHYINKMKESGQLDRIIRKWQPLEQSGCWQSKEFKKMGLENMVFAFALVVGAVALASLLFLGELLVRHRLGRPTNPASYVYDSEQPEAQDSAHYSTCSTSCQLANKADQKLRRRKSSTW